MRSRYTAYTQARADYLEKTWHSSTRPRLTQAELQATQWQRLEVIAAKPGLKKSVVEFKAYYVEQGTETCLHEVSLFKKEKKRKTAGSIWKLSKELTQRFLVKRSHDSRCSF
jgi:SEC-C motif-containing protein